MHVVACDQARVSSLEYSSPRRLEKDPLRLSLPALLPPTSAAGDGVSTWWTLIRATKG